MYTHKVEKCIAEHDTHLGWLQSWSLRFHGWRVLGTSPVHSLKSNAHTLHTERKHARRHFVGLTSQGFIINNMMRQIFGGGGKRIKCGLHHSSLILRTLNTVHYQKSCWASSYEIMPLLVPGPPPSFLHTEVHYNESLWEEEKLTPAHADESCSIPNGPKLLSHLEAMSHVVLHRESPELSTNTPYTS